MQQQAMQRCTVAVQVPEGLPTTTPPIPAVPTHPHQQAASRSLQEELLRTQLRMGRVIVRGHGGLVVRATLGEEAVVVKMYGPEPDGLEVYCTEFDAYSQLADLQGDVLPVLLAAGPLGDGVFAIAMKVVPGSTLHAVICKRGFVRKREAEAAMQALGRLHARGYLQGDVAPSNVVLLPVEGEEWEEEEEEEDAWVEIHAVKRDKGREEEEEEEGQPPPRCVVLDLGMARPGGTEQEKEDEIAQLAIELGWGRRQEGLGEEGLGEEQSE